MALKNKTEVLQSYCKVVPSLTVVFRFFMIAFFFYFILTQAYTIALAVTAECIVSILVSSGGQLCYDEALKAKRCGGF